MKHESSEWWREAVGYQIWPMSFKDSNGDGIGDIQGIISKLDYLKYLGIDLIWISPVYDSPQKDMGYDVRDYNTIWSKFGSLKDMEELIQGAHDRNMKIIMDLVINHTSNEHEWFLKSKGSRSKDQNPYADWYIWRDPKYRPTQGSEGDFERTPPNNWRSGFGGSAWEYVPERDQYYFHCALPEQPDLNWEVAETRKAIYSDAIAFWLDRGADGFRVDCVNCYCKDQSFPDAPVVISDDEYQPMLPEHFLNGPRMHEWLQEMRAEVLDKYGRDKVVIVGELLASDQSKALEYLCAQPPELNMTLDFDFVHTANSWFTEPHERQRFNMSEFKAAFEKTQGYLKQGAWTTAFLESHDYPRSTSSFGTCCNKYRETAAKTLALLITTMSGTLFLYQGQEIGMTNVSDYWTASDFKDHQTLQYLDRMQEKFPLDDAMREKALAGARLTSRDNGRTPVQWSSDTSTAGFTQRDVQPWIKVNERCKEINVSDQMGMENSVLEFWRRMLTMRKTHRDILMHGMFELHDRDNQKTFSYTKKGFKPTEGRTRYALVTLNLCEEPVEIFVPEALRAEKAELVMSTIQTANSDGGHLAPWEGRLYFFS